MLFSTLPAEIRHFILELVLNTPLSPPAVADEVRPQEWVYPHEEHLRRYSGIKAGDSECNPAIAFNTQSPWGLQYLPLLLVSKAFRADAENVLHRAGRNIQPTLDVMLERSGDFKATWLLAPSSQESKIDYLNVTIRTLGCMEIFGAQGIANVHFKRNTNISVARLLQRITSTGFSPHSKDRRTSGTRIRTVRLIIATPVDHTKDNRTEEERAPLATRLSEYFDLGYFELLSQRIDTIEIFVDNRKAYTFTSAKSHLRMQWSHKWRRDSGMND